MILFCCNRLAPTLELSFLMRSIQEHGLRPVAILESNKLLHQIPKGKLDKIDIFLLPQLLARYGLLTFPRLLSVLGKFARVIRLHVLADVFATWRGIVAGRRALEQLDKYGPINVVVVADDRSLGWEYGVVLAARQRGISTVAVPFALSDPDADWLGRQGKESFQPDSGWGVERFLKRRMRELYPSNIRVRNGEERMFLTAGQAWMLKRVKGEFERPWAYGGGISHVATVFGEFDRRKQISLGVKAHKLYVTGQSSIDLLHTLSNSQSEVRMAVIEKYSLSESCPIIICAVPQYLEHGLLNEKEHWALIDQLLGSLESTSANLLLSLHPRSRMQDYRECATAYGAIIADQPLIEIIAAADLFVSAMSSTVRWSILLRTPTIVLDDFNQGGQSMFAGKGVHFVQQRNELTALAIKLLTDSNERSETKRLLDEQACELDPFDGSNSSRLVQLLKILIQRPINFPPEITI